MPNGGVPLHMMIRPQDGSGLVVYCRGADLMVTTEADLRAGKADSSRLLRLNRDEALVLERFLRYWLHDEEDHPLMRIPGVQVVCDF